MKNQGIQFLTDPAPFQEKERLYFEVRRREGRIFPDEVVRDLPFISSSSPYAKEWTLRRRSFQRLEQYLKKRFSGKKSSILDLGCGNGWMANRLAQNTEWDVWAVDLNEHELAQGARLFGRENLHFVYADLLNVSASAFPGSFGVIVLAASVQYFPDLQALVAALRARLKTGGEIHFIDSPFYKNETERVAARQRTFDYYSKAGAPEMAVYYHHHTWPEIYKEGGKNLNNQLTVKILQKTGRLAPFPWIVL